MDEAPKPYVCEELDARSLHFSTSAIQSRMHLLRPDALELEYTRLMMGWLMLRPLAKRLAMIGLGGGSIAKFCHRHLPQTSMLAIEIDPRVIAFREAFQLPPDDTRLRVVCADGARFVAATDERFDVLMVDAFEAEGMPAALGAQHFYDDCLDALAADGLLVVNLHAGDPQRLVYVDRIARSFGHRTLCVDDKGGSNSVVFAAKGEALTRAGRGVLRKPAALSEDAWAQLRGEFLRIASTLQRAAHSAR